MTFVQEAEVAVITFATTWLTSNESKIESELGPVETVIENGILKLADGFFSKLPMGLGGMLEGLLQKYVSSFTQQELAAFVGQGITYVVNYLNALKAKIQAA